MPAEQQDRFPEPGGTACGDLAWTAGRRDHVEQAGDGLATFLGRSSMHIGHRRQLGDPALPSKLGGHCAPSMKHRRRWCLVRRAPPAVSVQPLEIEHTRAEPLDPGLERTRCDARIARHLRQYRPVGDDLADGVEHHLDARDLAWQRVERQDSLAVPTRHASGQSDRERHECVTRLQTPRDAATSQSEIATTAGSTAAAGQILVASGIDDSAVLARLHFEYEHHVLVTAPGVATLSGAVVCLPHCGPPRTQF